MYVYVYIFIYVCVNVHIYKRRRLSPFDQVVRLQKCFEYGHWQRRIYKYTFEAICAQILMAARVHRSLLSASWALLSRPAPSPLHWGEVQTLRKLRLPLKTPWSRGHKSVLCLMLTTLLTGRDTLPIPALGQLLCFRRISSPDWLCPYAPSVLKCYQVLSFLKQESFRSNGHPDSAQPSPP